MDCFAIPQTLGYHNMEIVIILLSISLVTFIGAYIHHQFKFRDTPDKLHHCKVPYEMYFHSKGDWQCRKCKQYWYVKHDKWGTYFVKRQ